MSMDPSVSQGLLQSRDQDGQQAPMHLDPYPYNSLLHDGKHAEVELRGQASVN